jgi:iron complex outermembrane receptor protein
MKDIKRKKLPSALRTVLGAGVAFTVVATGANAQQAQRVEKIEVTGTNIKRVDTETVAPIEVITREQIERTGQATVAEVLRNIPANSGGSFGESFTNSFASGAAGISLRGLGQKTTLVLLNGRRVAGYGFAQNLQDSFVDLNSIPTSAVERIEILKDGASAVYGSDAIAGVVNIILRKDYKGLELGISGGRFEGKNDYRFTATGGMGDLARDRYNIVGTFDYYKRDLLLMSDTDFGATRDFRQYSGGRNFQSLTAGGTFRQLTATNALTNNFRATSECRGFTVNGAQAVDLGLIGAPAGNTGFNIAGNTFCGVDQSKEITYLPKTERSGFVGRMTKEFSSNVTGYVDLGLSRVDTFQVFTTPFFAGTTGLQQTSGGLRPFTYNINLAPGVAGNPFATNARFSGNQGDLGTRDQRTVSDSIRVLAGANYTIGRWDLDSAVGWSRNKVDQDNFNRLTLAGVSSAFGIPSTPQPPIPTSTSSRYNLDRQSTNSQAVRDSLLVDVKREATSELKFADTKASAEFGSLPGGAIGVALGAEFRNEELKDRPDIIAQTGGVLGQGITATNGKRDNYAFYAEASLPITRMLEAQVAGRYDHYSDYGSSTTPKVGLKFKPTSSLLLRANWGKGFRAPSLPEISPSTATFFVQVNDPVTGQSGVQISGVFAGNPALQAEKSESATVGIVFEPNQNFSASVNYYQIDWKNIVSSQSFQSIVNSGDPTRIIRDPNNNNQIVTVLNNYVNLNQTKTDGLDFEARYRFNTELGKWTPRVNISYVNSYKEDGVEVAGTNAGNVATLPRTRGQLSLDWDYRALSTTLSGNYIRSYQQQLLPGSYFAQQDPRFQNGTYPDRVPTYITYDFFASYQLTKNLKISGSVINFNNKLPPYDPGASSTFLYDFSVYDPRGRQFRLGLTYKM